MMTADAATALPAAHRAMRDFLARESLIANKPMKLASGANANFYFDCKRATLHGNFLVDLADWVLDIAAQTNPDVIGGPTLGADFIVTAAVMRARQRGDSWVRGSVTRKQSKTHGTQNLIENNPATPSKILVVEDVITSGGSLAQSCDAYLAAGHSIAALACIVDREAGGRAFLETKYAAKLHSLFTLSDFPECKQ